MCAYSEGRQDVTLQLYTTGVTPISILNSMLAQDITARPSIARRGCTRLVFKSWEVRLPERFADSDGRRNTCLEFIRRSLEA